MTAAVQPSTTLNAASGTTKSPAPSTDGYPPLGAAPGTLVRYVQSLLQDTEQDATARYRKATQNLLFADGRQHIDWSIRQKTWRDVPESDTRIRVTMNYIRPILRSRAQRLMSTDLTWRTIPPSNAYEDRDKATVATNLIESRWKGSEMESKARQAIFLADNCGVAYLKQFWNPNIGPMTVASILVPHPQTGELTKYPIDAQGQVLADDQGNPLEGSELGFSYRPGDTDTAIRSLFNIRMNPDAVGLEPNEGFRWLVDSEVMPISVVKDRWGKRADGVQSTAGVGIMRQYERMVKSIAGRASAGNDLTTNRGGQNLPESQLTLYSEYWEAPSDKNPAGRLLIVAGETLLYPLTSEGDTEGLPQDFIPFVAVYSERRPFDAYGRPVVDDLVPPQRVVNAQWAAILEEQALHGVGQWAMFDLPGLSDQITNLSAAHIRIPMQSAYANRGIGELIQRINPPSSSPDRWNMLQEAKTTMFDIGAFHEIQRGQVPPGVDSGIAVQLLQEAENGQMHDSVRDLKRAFIAWGRQTGKLAKWGYGEHEERWIPQQRPDLGYLVESVTGLDLPDFDTIDIDLEGFRPTSQAALNAEIKDAMVNGWLDPRKGLQMMDLGRGIQGAFESQTRHYSRARRENMALERGEFTLVEAPEGSPGAASGMPAFVHLDGGSFLLPQDDDHLIHIEIHQELALDDALPLEQRQSALLHISEHRMILQAQMVAEQAQAMLQQHGPPDDPNKPTAPGAE